MENHDLVKHAVRCALATGMAGAAAPLALAANGQPPQQTQNNAAQSQQNQQVQNLGTVSVTGSRIKRTDIVTAQPVLRLSHEQIETSGIENLGELLQTLTSSGASLNTVFNNGGTGATNINLRYLGSQRVLVLLNGKRLNTGLGSAVNLNHIPISIIDHIEVLKNGASALYGSDAIAGVVNVITRQDFDGAEASAYYGKWQSNGGDRGGWSGTTREYDFSIGTQSDNSGVFFSAQYYKQDPIFGSERDYGAVPIYGTGNTQGSSGTPNGRFVFNTPSIPAGLNSNACPPTGDGLFQCDLTLKHPVSGTPKPSDYRAFTAQDAYNYAPSNYIITPLETTNVYLQGHYDLTPNVTFKSDILYTRQQSQQHLAATPLFITSGSIAANIPASANPFGIDLDASGDAGTNVALIGRRAVEAGPRVFNQSNPTFRFEGGFEGGFTAADRLWNWNADYIFGHHEVHSRTEGLFNTQRLLYAVSGCPDEPVPPAAGIQCVPYTALFRGKNGAKNVKKQNAYATYTNKDTTESNIRLYEANLSSDNLFELPAGGLGFAIGYEYREVDGQSIPDPTEFAGNSSGAPGVNVTPAGGRYNVDSEYIEVNIPLLAHMAGARDLNLDLANRWFDYSSFGTGTAGQVGLKWQPIHDLLFRAEYSQGFRAPNVSDLFAGEFANFPQVKDPCDTSNGERTGVVAANCKAKGVPQSYSQPNQQIRSLVGGSETLAPVITQLTGNPAEALGPETSTSKTLGVVYSPGWAPGLNVNVGYYHIEVSNAIQTVGADNIVNFCYHSKGLSSPYCGLMSRSSTTHAINSIVDAPRNIGGVLTTGFDGGVTYRFPATSFGTFRARLESTFVQRYDIYFPGKSVVHVAGTSGSSSGYGATIGNTIPRHKTNLEFDWAYGGFNAALIAHYDSHTSENCTVASSFPKLCTYPKAGKNELPSVTWFDAKVTYNFPQNVSVTFGVRNLTNRRPPLQTDAFQNSFDPSAYAELLGRFPYLRVTARF